MNRIEMFKFLEEHNIPTAQNGYVDKIVTYSDIKYNNEFIIYTDLDAHRAEGKIKISAKEALEEYKDYYCSRYMNFEYGISYRELIIGDIYCLLKFYSHDWRSNYGDVDVKIIRVKRDWQNLHSIDLPLYAIDYIKKHDRYYAVDFNIAPQIKGTGLEDIISAKEVVDEIRKKVEKDNP
jgi:hypothetical protein